MKNDIKEERKGKQVEDARPEATNLAMLNNFIKEYLNMCGCIKTLQVFQEELRANVRNPIAKSSQLYPSSLAQKIMRVIIMSYLIRLLIQGKEMSFLDSGLRLFLLIFNSKIPP